MSTIMICENTQSLEDNELDTVTGGLPNPDTSPPRVYRYVGLMNSNFSYWNDFFAPCWGVPC